MPILNELKLAKELIRFPSITPVDAGTINFLARKLRSLGFKCKILEFKSKNSKPVKNLYARLGKSKPNFCYAGHTDVVAPGNLSDWTVNPFKPKVKGKTAGWTKEDFEKAGFRMVPNSPVRKGSYIGKNVVLMPCFVNVGAYIDEGTMMDTFSRAGSCCQIGKNCHISAGSGVGGVLEPAQALPTIIEDNVFLGAMSEVVEGIIVGEGSVLSMGMYIGQSTKIVDRKTGEISYGKIPPYSVVVPGSLPDKKNPNAPSLNCAVIIKQVDEKTRSKTSINDLLRE